MKVTANHSKKTFTIRTGYAKYRTIRLDKHEFKSCLYNTENDWKQFLKSGDYYLIKK